MPYDSFPELNDHFVKTSKGIDTHCFVLVKFICTEYVELRRFYTIKLTNFYLTGDNIGHKLKQNNVV